MHNTNINTEGYELKKAGIKNCSPYYFDDIIRIEDFDFDNFLLDEKSYENVLICDVSYKTVIGAKPLRIMFDKVNRFIRVYDGDDDTGCLHTPSCLGGVQSSSIIILWLKVQGNNTTNMVRLPPFPNQPPHQKSSYL